MSTTRFSLICKGKFDIILQRNYVYDPQIQVST